MTGRAPSLRAGSADVLVALAAAGPAGLTMTNLLPMTRLPVGRLLAVLLDCANLGCVRRETAPDDSVRYGLTGSGIAGMKHHVNGAIWATGEGVRKPALLALSVAAAEYAVRGLPFLVATRYRDEVRACLAMIHPAAQPWHALSVAIQGRRALRRSSSAAGTRLHHHRHVFTVRFDDSASFGRCYQECTYCGAFRNTLFGDRIPSDPRLSFAA